MLVEHERTSVFEWDCQDAVGVNPVSCERTFKS